MKKLVLLLVIIFLFLTYSTAYAEGKDLAGNVASSLIKKGYESTGHYCPEKPWYVFFMPEWLWWSLTCGHEAR